MAKKYLTVEEALDQMRGRKSSTGKVVVNRFNKKKFNLLMQAIANDPNFKERVTIAHGTELDHEDIMVSKGFRKWCKHLLESAGMDAMESDVVMSDGFKFDNMDGLYEFFASALYQYMAAGNQFGLLGKDDLYGGIEIREVEKNVRTGTARSPKTGEILGQYETTQKKHREVKSKTKCPAWLTSKRLK